MSGIHFVEVDAERMLEDARRMLEELLGEPMQPGDARYMVLTHVMQLIVGGFAWIDQMGRSNLLRYAMGEVLDAMGERVGTPRLQAAPAVTTLRFTLSAARTLPTVIPVGTRATPDGRVNFVTTKAITIQPGVIKGDAPAASVLEGAADGQAHNGLPAGTIMALVDPVPFVARVESIEPSAGGRAREADGAYRERIRLAPSHFAATGTADAYLYHARSATTLVTDAAVRQAGPGEVEIAVLVADDAEAPAAVALEVLQYVSDPERRTLTDLVSVHVAEEVPYNIDVTYYAHPMRIAAVVQAVEGTGGALERYLDWQDNKIGHAINPDKLRALMLEAGAQRIDLHLPLFAEVGVMRRARHGTVTMHHVPAEVTA